MRARKHTTSCRHGRHELLGVDSTAYFYRCADCGEVTVVQVGLTWRLRPSIA